jgi:hypothetical protein
VRLETQVDTGYLALQSVVGCLLKYIDRPSGFEDWWRRRQSTIGRPAAGGLLSVEIAGASCLMVTALRILVFPVCCLLCSQRKRINGFAMRQAARREGGPGFGGGYGEDKDSRVIFRVAANAALEVTLTQRLYGAQGRSGGFESPGSQRRLANRNQFPCFPLTIFEQSLSPSDHV